MKASLEFENVIHDNDTLIAIGGPLLTALAQTGKGKVVELTSERGKGVVVEVSGQNILFDLGSTRAKITLPFFLEPG